MRTLRASDKASLVIGETKTAVSLSLSFPLSLLLDEDRRNYRGRGATFRSGKRRFLVLNARCFPPIRDNDDGRDCVRLPGMPYYSRKKV